MFETTVFHLNEFFMFAISMHKSFSFFLSGSKVYTSTTPVFTVPQRFTLVFDPYVCTHLYFQIKTGDTFIAVSI